MPTLEAAAAELQGLQERMVRALASAETLPGFDAVRLRRAAEALAAKRARAVARAWPTLAAALGDDFALRFAAFAALAPLPRHGGALADGRAFAGSLHSAGNLSDAVVRDVLAIDLRFVLRADGLHPRRGPALRWAWLNKPRRLLVGVRLPWLGCRTFSIRLGW